MLCVYGVRVHLRNVRVACLGVRAVGLNAWVVGPGCACQCLRNECLGFRVYGLGFRVQGLGFRF